MATPQEKAQCVSWFIKTESDVQTQRNYRNKYGRDPQLHPSIRARDKKFIWKQVQYWIKRGVGNQEYLRKTSSVFQKLLIVLLGSPSALLPESCNLRVQQCTMSSTRAYGCTLTKCNCYRHSSQMTSPNEEILQSTCWNEFLRMKHSFPVFVSLMKQRFMFQEN